ncbi:C-type lectin domain family 17, member A-like isoform X2 [Labeo rohita]|uniref:C-type lectin domain family 17, member A-like isoform X2 n=1 Tax=Labeo rohita TaxID=84645 RepID=UPI0021E2F903|nr:C-type lectin domain family 17, member A-like isoform X2 [Labeo rohita]
MSDDIYDDAIGIETEAMKKEKLDMTVEIYESADHLRDQDFRTETNTHKPLQQTGSDSVRIRNYRAAVVCLVLLCVLLLTAVIVLCVHIHTNSTNYTEETHQPLTNITNLIEERDELLTNEKDGLLIKNDNLTKQREQCFQERNYLVESLQKIDGRLYYNSSFYFISSEKKSWNESRRYCTEEKEADLIIINNREEQEFAKKFSHGNPFWIGLTDSDVEDSWKWADGSTLTSGFWATNGKTPEPNGKRDENCAVTCLRNHPQLIGWIDVTCNGDYQWICEKSI